MNKPNTLYHGSCVQGIQEFTPRQRRDRNGQGVAIAATPNRDVALAFMFPTDIASHTIGNTRNGTYVVLEAEREEILQADNGGSLYTLPSDTFTKNKHSVGMGPLEWSSTANITPLKEEQHDSVIDALVDAGVQVYFVDNKTYEKALEDPENKAGLLNRIESENKHRSVNIKEL